MMKIKIETPMFEGRMKKRTLWMSVYWMREWRIIECYDLLAGYVASDLVETHFDECVIIVGSCRE